jgi:hypothetical protein
MPRQRVHLEGSALATVAGRALAAAFGAALVFYGAMLVLLALKVDPGTVDGISGYRTAYDFLSSLEPGDVSSTARLVVGVAAAAIGLGAAALVYLGRPRARLARHAVVVAEDPRGVIEVRPRAIERAAEAAALEDAGVDGARARYDDGGVVLAIGARDALRVPQTLHDAERRARESLDRHGLAVDRLEVQLVRFNSNNRRELA